MNIFRPRMLQSSQRSNMALPIDYVLTEQLNFIKVLSTLTIVKLFLKGHG